MNTVHDQFRTCDIIEIGVQECVEYRFANGAKVRIIIPDQIELVQDCQNDLDDESDTQDFEGDQVPGFSCSRCGEEQILLTDANGHDYLPNHIEECLGLEPQESEEGAVTTIRYS